MSNKPAGILIILFFCLSCSLNNEKNQYIVSKNGNNLEPYAKVTYKINTYTGTIFYWTEKPGQKRSQPHELKNCKMEDLNNWEGIAENILLWRVKVKFNNGRFASLGAGLENVDWFTWSFRTASNPASLFKFPDAGIPIWGIFVVLGILGLIIAQGLKWSRKGYRESTLQRQLLSKGRTKSSTSLPPQKGIHEWRKFKEPWPVPIITTPKKEGQKREPSPAQDFSGKVMTPEAGVTNDMLAAEEKSVNREDQPKSDPQIDLQAMLKNLDEKEEKIPDQ